MDCVYPLRIEFGVPVRPDLTVSRFAYLYVIDGDPICLVDTGVAGAEAAVADALREHGRSLAGIGTVVLTHSHPDHMGAAARICAVSGAAVWAHRGEQAWIEDPDRQARERPVPGFAQLVAGPVRVARLLEEGDRIALGRAGEFGIWHTPGHSAGSICLVQPESGVVFCGDVVPRSGEMPVYEDVVALAHSLVRLLRLPHLRLLYSAWAEPLAGAAATAAVEAGLRYLALIDRTVREATATDPVELCRECVLSLGLPPGSANPLVLRSFLAHRAPEARAQLASILVEVV